MGVYIASTLTITERMNVWWGYRYLEVHGIMFPNGSWVRPNNKTEIKLNYARTHHKIAELYARKIYFYLDSNKIGPGDINKFTDVFDKYDKKFQDCIEQYEKETKYGEDTTLLRNWIDRINKEFEMYPTNGSYKLHKFL